MGDDCQDLDIAFKALLEAFVPAIGDSDLDKVMEIAKRDIPFCFEDPNIDMDMRAFLQMTAGHDKYLPMLWKLLNHLLKPMEISVLKVVLYMLTSTYGTFVLTGCRYLRPFTALTVVERELVLKQWSESPFTPKRVICRLFKQLAMFTIGGYTENGSNPFWPLLGYPKPPVLTTLKIDAKTFPFLNISEDSTLEFDVVVVGSGAGGGIAAYELAAAGYKVLVCEKGGFNRSPNVHLTELDYFEKMCDNKGFVISQDSSMNVVAGSTFGGGTTINWSASFATPGHVREEWAEKFGLDFSLSHEFQESIDRVSSRIGVTTDNVHQNTPNSLLLEGCRKLGYHAYAVPQNTGGKEHECGFCGFGCPTATKLGTMETYLHDAGKLGAKFLSNCFVEKIIRNSEGRVEHIVASVENDTKKHQITVKCKMVVVAAGSLHTPCLLLRSGFKNSNIGKNLKLHPVTVVAGYFPDKQVDPFKGGILTSVSTVADNPDGSHYGCKIEVPWVHPAMYCGLLPYGKIPNGYFQHNEKELQTPLGIYGKLRTLKYSRVVPMIILQRDRDSLASVVLDPAGLPQLKFALGPKDAKSLLNGIEKAMNILQKVGVKEIYHFVEDVPCYLAEQEAIGDIAAPTYQQFIQELRKSTLCPPHNTALLSAHQMSSCRMSSSPSTGACNPKGQLYECQDVWICDGSVLPTCTGVNPMLSIMAVADVIAKRCVEYMKEIKKE